MKTRHAVLFSTILVLSSVITANCASLPKPTSSEPFIGEWVNGIWESAKYRGVNGGVSVVITPMPDGKLLIAVTLTNSRFASWSTPAEFKDGKLVVDRPKLKMELTINKKGRLEATYDNVGVDDGTWSSLTKKN